MTETTEHLLTEVLTSIPKGKCLSRKISDHTVLHIGKYNFLKTVRVFTHYLRPLDDHTDPMLFRVLFSTDKACFRTVLKYWIT